MLNPLCSETDIRFCPEEILRGCHSPHSLENTCLPAQGLCVGICPLALHQRVCHWGASVLPFASFGVPTLKQLALLCP